MEIPDATPSSKQVVPVAMTSSTAFGAGATNFCGFGTFGIFSTVDNLKIPMPFAGTLRNFRLRNTTTMAAAGGMTVTLMKNAVATAVSFSWDALEGAETEKTDLVSVISFAEGDQLSFQIVNDNAIGGNDCRYRGGVELRPT